MDVLPLLDELQMIARNGLNYAQDFYDRERYTRILELVSLYYGQVLDTPAPTVRSAFTAELGQITPKVGADAAIFDDDGRILLVKRADNGTWCLPCGWLDSNESPAEGAVREAWEETGLRVRPVRLVDVFTRRPGSGHGPHTLVAVVYWCEVLEGQLRNSHESTDLRYWVIDEVPVWHGLHREYAQAAQRVWQSAR